MVNLVKTIASRASAEQGSSLAPPLKSEAAASATRVPVAADLGGLRAKAEMLELLLNATPDGVVDWDLLSNRVDYNPRWRHMLGYDDDAVALPDVTAHGWQELIHPDDQSATQKLLGEHLEQGWPFTTTVRMRHGAGGYRHIMCRGSAQRDENDRPVRMLIIFSDIDDRIRDEVRQRALVSALPDTLFRVRSDGRISGVKRGHEREGSPFASLKEGLTLADCIGDARALARLQAALIADLGGPSQSATTLRITSATPEGAPLHHEVRIVRSGDDESVCIVRDVSEQRELEERLLETQKLGAIGQLAAGVAHEINTPMQFIGDNLHYARGALAELVGLLERYKAALQSVEAALGSERVAELVQAEDVADFDYSRKALPTALERSLTGVERVTNIVRAMKSFAHPGGDTLTPTDLKELIESTVMVATSEWKYVADVDLELDPNLPHVPCVAGQLNQVILNLIVNAAHAISDVVGTSGDKGRIVIQASSDDTHAEIRIADSGTGIPEHARGKVFEPFFTTKEVGKGTGQGLAMAHSCVVKGHRGAISFETELGVGTTFIVRLPLVAASIVRSGAPA